MPTASPVRRECSLEPQHGPEDTSHTSSEFREAGTGWTLPWPAHTLSGTAQVCLTATRSLEGQWQTPQLALNSWELSATVCSGVLFPSDAPGAAPDTGWEGHIRASKRRTGAGDGHEGCTGNALESSLPQPVEC